MASLHGPSWFPSAGPACLCVGMPKCGTSTFHAMLDDIPPFFAAPIKEFNYFVLERFAYRGEWRRIAFSDHWIPRQERRALRGEVRRILTFDRSPAALGWMARYLWGARDDRWYQALFPKGAYGVDASPVYHTLPADEIARVRNLAPDARVVILLRSPLAQLWSHCRMVVVGKQGSQAVADLADHVRTQIALRRSYAGLIADWRAAYPGRVFIGDMSAMTADPRAFVARFLAFMELDPALAARARVGTHVNKGAPLAVPDALRDTIAAGARARLEGFEAIDPDLAAAWSVEVDGFMGGASIVA